jgi:hypothetical protein
MEPLRKFIILSLPLLAHAVDIWVNSSPLCNRRWAICTDIAPNTCCWVKHFSIHSAQIDRLNGAVGSVWLHEERHVEGGYVQCGVVVKAAQPRRATCLRPPGVTSIGGVSWVTSRKRQRGCDYWVDAGADAGGEEVAEHVECSRDETGMDYAQGTVGGQSRCVHADKLVWDGHWFDIGENTPGDVIGRLIAFSEDNSYDQIPDDLLKFEVV